MQHMLRYDVNYRFSISLPSEAQMPLKKIWQLLSVDCGVLKAFENRCKAAIKTSMYKFCGTQGQWRDLSMNVYKSEKIESLVKRVEESRKLTHADNPYCD